jgi:hypothetical protein
MRCGLLSTVIKTNDGVLVHVPNRDMNIMAVQTWVWTILYGFCQVPHQQNADISKSISVVKMQYTPHQAYASKKANQMDQWRIGNKHSRTCNGLRQQKYAGSWIDITNVYSTLQTNNLLYLKAYRRKKTNPRVRTAEENMWRGDKQYLPYMRMMMQQTPTQ